MSAAMVQVFYRLEHREQHGAIDEDERVYVSPTDLGATPDASAVEALPSTRAADLAPAPGVTLYVLDGQRALRVRLAHPAA